MVCTQPVSAERPVLVSQSFQIKSHYILGEFTSLSFTFIHSFDFILSVIVNTTFLR